MRLREFASLARSPSMICQLLVLRRNRLGRGAVSNRVTELLQESKKPLAAPMSLGGIRIIGATTALGPRNSGRGMFADDY